MNRRIVILGTLLLVAIAAFFFNQNWNRVATGTTIDRILIEKSQRKLSILQKGRRLKTYRVALGKNPVGSKEQEGDNKTPEGIYYVDERKENSDYHLALHLSYPDEHDVARAAARGVSAGSDIEIHGLPNDKSWFGPIQAGIDWTAGCIAVTNAEIEELWRVTPVGTTVEIVP